MEIGTLESMRHLSNLTVDVVFDSAPPELTRVPGVRAVVVRGRQVQLTVQGTIAPLMDALAGTGVRERLSREPSLEELFLSHYGSGPTTAVTADGAERVVISSA